MPIAIQKFLHVDNKKCQISLTNTNLKPHHVCMLRHGVEVNKLQSFIACIADVFVEVTTSDNILSIVQMKEHIINSINLDSFLTYQNGNLPKIFGSDKDVNVDNYTNTKIYKSIGRDTEYLRKIISAYENFVDFLRDDNILIDQTYLWDIICQPNPNLFPQGINLVIIEMPDDDITNNVQIICPTNHYSNTFFDINKKTLILVKRDLYYEPIYAFEDIETNFRVTRLFSLKNRYILPNIKNVLEMIKISLNDKCGPLPSLPNKYTFKTNLPLSKMISKLTSLILAETSKQTVGNG